MKLLYKTIVGSKLYGIQNEDSDTDIKGFCLPEINELVGLNDFEHLVESVGEGKDKVETTTYTLRKLFRLLMKGNPTTLEIVFAPKEYWVHSTKLGEEIIEFCQANFLTKHLFGPYSAYFRSQLAKLQRPEREGKRQVLIDKYGYDVKFAAHAYRLGFQCIDIMTKETFAPVLSEKAADVCKRIRMGQVLKRDMIDCLDRLDKNMYATYQDSVLKEHLDFHKINDFLVKVHTNYVKGEYDSDFT